MVLREKAAAILEVWGEGWLFVQTKFQAVLLLLGMAAALAAGLAALVLPPEPKPEYLRPAALSVPPLHATPGSFLPTRGAWGHWDRDRLGERGTAG